MSVFGKHYSYMQPGRYLYRISRASLDTTSLKDGIYDLVVTATDIRGNSTHDTLRFTVHNRPGWVGS
jgi:nitrous oxidase accessory protein NosD